MRNKSGFSLLELMITIAIIGILAVVAVPNMIAWRNNAQLSRGARQIYSELQEARKTAIKHNRMVTISFAANDYTVVRPDPANPSATVSITKNLPPGVVITSAVFVSANPGYGGTIASFNGMGFGRDFSNADNGGAVTVSRAGGGRTSTITVNSAGSIRIQ